MIALSPCPMCGSSGWLSKPPSRKFYIACTRCFIATLEYRTESEAALAWNRRTQPAPPLPTREEVAEIICCRSKCVVGHDDRHCARLDKAHLDRADAVLRLLGGDDDDA
ncbi:MAG TPA: Lar family restriction alleviation protein [Acetobacteraceae bacterium]|nr:Lar family restriction alleviation protein [Acetobacteraceae bacterium]